MMVLNISSNLVGDAVCTIVGIAVRVGVADTVGLSVGLNVLVGELDRLGEGVVVVVGVVVFMSVGGFDDDGWVVLSVG